MKQKKLQTLKQAATIGKFQKWLRTKRHNKKPQIQQR